MSQYVVDAGARARYPSKYHVDVESDAVKTLDSIMIACADEYCEMFPVADDIKWKSQGCVAHYVEGQGMPAHTDNTATYDAAGNVLFQHAIFNTLTCAVMLNEYYDGGETRFPLWDLVVRPRGGDVLIYPSSFIGYHEVLPVTRGERSVYLSWFGHGDAGDDVNMSKIDLNSRK